MEIRAGAHGDVEVNISLQQRVCNLETVVVCSGRFSRQSHAEWGPFQSAVPGGPLEQQCMAARLIQLAWRRRRRNGDRSQCCRPPSEIWAVIEQELTQPSAQVYALWAEAPVFELSEQCAAARLLQMWWRRRRARVPSDCNSSKGDDKFTAMVGGAKGGDAVAEQREKEQK